MKVKRTAKYSKKSRYVKESPEFCLDVLVMSAFDNQVPWPARWIRLMALVMVV